MCCLPSCQDLCQDSGKETWDSSLEQGGVLLKVGTTQPAEADRLPGAPVSNLPVIPSGDAGCVQEEEARQPGDRDVTPDSWSLQAPLASSMSDGHKANSSPWEIKYLEATITPPVLYQEEGSCIFKLFCKSR